MFAVLNKISPIIIDDTLIFVTSQGVPGNKLGNPIFVRHILPGELSSTYSFHELIKSPQVLADIS